MDLSVVIVSFNTKKLLDDCLASLYKSTHGQSFTMEIIVVDNVSTDGTREMLVKKYSNVITILNSENVGFGRANNQGIKKSKGAYILLLNSDTIVPNRAIYKLYEFTKKHPRSFVGPKLLNMDRTPQTSCGPFFSLLVVFAALFLKGDIIGLTRFSPKTTKRVDWVSGACFMGAKKLFEDDLLFDEKIFMYMEEVDLLMRAKYKGYGTYFYAGCSIIHLGGGSSVNRRTGPVLNIYRGLMYVYRKHCSKRAFVALTILLRLKAYISIVLGRITRSSYLTTTYAEALKLV